MSFNSLFWLSLLICCVSKLEVCTALNLLEPKSQHREQLDHGIESNSFNIFQQKEQNLVSHSNDPMSLLPSMKSRRKLGSTIFASLFVLPTIITYDSGAANAANPITVEEAENFQARAQRLIRSKPPKILRPKLSQDFAVLLMRSAYAAVDDLDCIAMEQFQRDFFIIRQAEYEPYVMLLGPGFVKQGELSDPYYFDFISFAQYATINRAITKDPRFVFEEQVSVFVGEDLPLKFTTQIVKRDPQLPNNKLGQYHTSKVGKLILTQLEKTFGNTPASLPKIIPNSRPNAELLLSTLSQLVNLFLINGYAYDGSVVLVEGSASTSINNDAKGATFRFTLKSPATIWSGKALQLQKSQLQNNFLLIAATELIVQAGYEIPAISIKYNESDEISTLTIR